jgi:hypothetical protein
MPLRPELNYFFLYIKHYLEGNYRIRVQRGDSDVLTKELLNKVSAQITEAFFLIADITAKNANVFFELGIAHEKKKPVIFLTQDDPKDAPVDIRQFEFIRYQLDRHEDFLARLDNAVRNVLGANLNIPQLYEEACALLAQFNNDSRFGHAHATLEEFHDRVVRAVVTHDTPPPDDSVHRDDFLLPRVLQDLTDPRTIDRVAAWLEKRGPGRV